MAGGKLVFLVFTFLFARTSYGQIVNGSFETGTGTFSLEGWQNYGGVSKSNTETPIGGGIWSLELGGGDVIGCCVRPIAEIQNGDIYELKCWAKLLSGWGGFGWVIGRNISQHFVPVSNTDWTQISIVDTFYLNTNDTVELELQSGGGLTYCGTTLFDLVQVQKIGTITSIGGYSIEGMLKSFTLKQNYPNPFNPTTTIEFALAEDSKVSLKVFNMLGCEVATLVDAKLTAGKLYNASLNASKLSSGMYFYRLETYHTAGSHTEKDVLVKKMMLIK
jgi:hypothetical protein